MLNWQSEASGYNLWFANSSVAGKQWSIRLDLDRMFIGNNPFSGECFRVASFEGAADSCEREEAEQVELNAAIVLELKDRDQVKPFFEDGLLVIGWRDSKEVLVRIGANTPANRALAQVVARAIRTC